MSRTVSTTLAGRGPGPDQLRDLTLGLDLCDLRLPRSAGVANTEKARRLYMAGRERFSQDAVVG